MRTIITALLLTACGPDAIVVDLKHAPTATERRVWGLDRFYDGGHFEKFSAILHTDGDVTAEGVLSERGIEAYDTQRYVTTEFQLGCKYEDTFITMGSKLRSEWVEIDGDKLEAGVDWRGVQPGPQWGEMVEECRRDLDGKPFVLTP